MDPQLMAAFGFDIENLTANRAGYLSQKQEKRMKGDAAWANRVLLVIALLAGGIAVVLLLPLLRGDEFPTGRWIPVIVLGLVALWTFRGIFVKPDMTVQRVHGQVRFTQSTHKTGSVTDSAIDRHNVVTHYLVVGGQSFGISPDRIPVVVDGANYAVYYIDQHKQILSLERL